MHSSPLVENVPAGNRAFSLIEVTLAIGIVSFAMLALVSAMPVGLSTMRRAMDHTVESQIIRQIDASASSTQYGQLSPTFAARTFYYDNDGSALSEAESGQARYWATITLAPPSYPGSAAATDLTNSLCTMHIALMTGASGHAFSTNYYNVHVPNSGN